MKVTARSLANGEAQIPDWRESSAPPGAVVHFATAEVYEIVQQLPESDGEYQYKIKSLDESHLIVVKESQLSRV
jgi:hypothetical protein